MNLILKAKVTSAKGTTQHAIGTISENQPRATQMLPLPSEIAIAPEDTGYLLLRFDHNGRCLADTWHDSVEGAKKQAEFEFGTGEEDWTSE